MSSKSRRYYNSSKSRRKRRRYTEGKAAVTIDREEIKEDEEAKQKAGEDVSASSSTQEESTQAEIAHEESLYTEEGAETEFSEVLHKWLATQATQLAAPGKWYVLDTNVILACVDILYAPDDPTWCQPLDFKPCLDDTHLIIPAVVYEELDHIKGSHNANSLIASKALRRMWRFFQNSERTIGEIMSLARPIPTGWRNQTISIMPLHRDFARALPYVPSETDNDGWIAVTALAATMVREGLPANGTISHSVMLSRSNKLGDVILLTNDNGLLSKADMYGVRAEQCSFTPRPPFTGRRDLVVPVGMFAKFYHEGRLTGADFARYMPEQPPLVANEYIVMTPENDHYPRLYFAEGVPFANVARYHKCNDTLYPLRFMKYEGADAPNAGIATYYDAMNDDTIKVIVATGRAGTGKTFQAIVHALHAVEAGKFLGVKLIIDPDNGIGYLPGKSEDKVEPMIAFCKDAIRSYLSRKPEFRKKRDLLRKYGGTDAMPEAHEVPTSDKCSGRRRRKGHQNSKIEQSPCGCEATSIKTYDEMLTEQVDYIYRRHFEAIPYKQARSRSFEDVVIIIDEAQRIVIDDMETFITRLARNSLLIVCGDVNQIRLNSPEKRLKNGITFTRMIYQDWEGCANIYLTENLRHQATDIANRNYDRVMAEIEDLWT